VLKAAFIHDFESAKLCNWTEYSYNSSDQQHLFVRTLSSWWIK